jgi:hypothetical protein
MAGPSGIVGDSALGKDSQRKLGDPAVGERQRNQRFARIHNRDNGVGRESDRHRGGVPQSVVLSPTLPLKSHPSAFELTVRRQFEPSQKPIHKNFQPKFPAFSTTYQKPPLRIANTSANFSPGRGTTNKFLFPE